MQIGLYTFGELTPHWQTGRAISAQQRLDEILAAARLADDAGLAVFALGEHHRLDFSISATPVALAAIAATTRRIRLSSAVTILSTSDPVKVFEDFATVDLVSSGRAELIAGRGAFVESFPLFGNDVAQSDDLFVEKLDLLLKLRESKRVTWSGRFRTPLNDAAIAPRPVQQPLPVWVGCGGTPASAARAGRLGLPMALANISKPPADLVPITDLYRRSAKEAGHDASTLRLSISSHLFVQKTSQAALDGYYPHYAAYRRHHVPFPHFAKDVSRAEFEALAGAKGAIFVGSPQQIVDKIMYERELFGHELFMAQIDIGGAPFAKVAEMIELLASEVAPAVASV
jgi:alkanesulfonate monooxygenase SsuD/methylene tetrahydromethanopterin reductase-like flavin-dependent oxidoreductase (luciferase family)